MQAKEMSSTGAKNQELGKGSKHQSFGGDHQSVAGADLKQSVLAMLGFAQRAGKVVSGEAAVRNSVLKGRTKLLLLGTDASQATLKVYKHMADRFRIPLFFPGTREELGSAIGKSPRAAVGITDTGFARRIIENIAGEVERKKVDLHGGD